VKQLRSYSSHVSGTKGFVHASVGARATGVFLERSDECQDRDAGLASEIEANPGGGPHRWRIWSEYFRTSPYCSGEKFDSREATGPYDVRCTASS
jgi:hypothetical protein